MKGASDKRSKWTHFLSLPLCSGPSQRSALYAAHQEFVTRVSALPLFRKEPPTSVEPGSASAAAGYMDPTLFVPPQNYHLSVLMLSLPTAKDVERAKRVLGEVPAKVLSKHALPEGTAREELWTVRLRGLRSFNNGRSSTRTVVYCNVEPRTPELAAVLADVRAHFDAAGIATNLALERNFVLHLTLMNATQRRLADGSKPKAVVPFDARPVLTASSLSGMDFGTQRLDQLCICKMGATDKGYTTVASISLE